MSDLEALISDAFEQRADIHPMEKQAVGKRLARWALARAYGDRSIVPSGPIYREMENEGRMAIDGASVSCRCPPLAKKRKQRERLQPIPPMGSPVPAYARSSTPVYGADK